MSSNTEFVNIPGARLWTELGGDGQPLILVHGFTLDHRMWDPEIAALRAKYRVLRYDERGFGQSSLPSDEPYADDPRR